MYVIITDLNRKLTYDGLVRMGIYKAEEIKKDSWLDIFGGNAPRDFVSLTELAYRLSRNSASFGEVSDAEILNRLATLNRLLALAGYNLANSLIYGPGGVVYDLNSRFDSLEATGVADRTLPGEMTAATNQLPNPWVKPDGSTN